MAWRRPVLVPGPPVSVKPDLDLTAMERRTFLRTAAGAGLGGWWLAGAADAAAAWDAGPRGAGRFARERVGLQLYTVRSLMQRDVEATLRAVAETGYREVEFAGYFDHDPAQLRALLDRLELAAPSAHVPLELLRADLDGVLGAAEAVGHRYLVCPWIPEAERTPDGYRRIALDFNRFGAACRDRGVRFAYHNHDFEFSVVDGRPAYDLLLESTDPGLVAMELDLFWITRAGADPEAYFERHPGRFPLWHVKDMAEGGRMVDVGQGRIDFGRIFARADRAGLRHFFVEHDQPEEPLASIRQSYRYLARLLS